MLECSLEDLGLDLTFSCEAEEVGVLKTYDIKTNGRNIPVTDDNKMEYIQLITQFRMYVVSKRPSTIHGRRPWWLPWPPSAA